ncbi:MAG: energy transducer TonB [Gammaproteobacteria bacterium]
MQKALGSLLAGLFVAGCVNASPPVPSKPRPAPPIMIGTPVSQAMTPELQALINGPTDQQVLLRFTVKADGSVQNPQAAFSKLSPADTTSALMAFQQWRFKPALDGVQAVDRGFIYPLFFGPDASRDRTLFFCRNQAQIYEPDSTCEIVTTGQWRIYRMDPVYPPELLSQRLAGSVTLAFDIGAHGQVVNPKVIAATPPDLFNAAALAAVKQWYLEPLTGKNGDGPTQHVTITVKFTPPVAGHRAH